MRTRCPSASRPRLKNCPSAWSSSAMSNPHESLSFAGAHIAASRSAAPAARLRSLLIMRPPPPSRRWKETQDWKKKRSGEFREWVRVERVRVWGERTAHCDGWHGETRANVLNQISPAPLPHESTPRPPLAPPSNSSARLHRSFNTKTTPIFARASNLAVRSLQNFHKHFA